MGNPQNRSRRTSRKRKASKTDQEDTSNAKAARKEDQTPDSEARPTSSTRQDEATTPLTTRSNIETTSSSSKKLRERIQSYSKDLENSEGNDGFVIFSIGVLKDVFSFICCPGCKQESVALEEVIEKKQGLAINFRLKCPLCLWQHQFFSSPYANVPCKKSKNSMEVNVRLAMAFRNAGIGYDTLENVCTHMNNAQANDKK